MYDGALPPAKAARQIAERRRQILTLKAAGNRLETLLNTKRASIRSAVVTAADFLPARVHAPGRLSASSPDYDSRIPP